LTADPHRRGQQQNRISSMPLRRVYCRRIRKPLLTIERRREQLPKAAGRSHDWAPSAHLRVLFPRCRSLRRRRGPKPYRSPARRFAATVAMIANRAGYRPALHPDPEASPRVGILHCPPCRQTGLSSSCAPPARTAARGADQEQGLGHPGIQEADRRRLPRRHPLPANQRQDHAGCTGKPLLVGFPHPYRSENRFGPPLWLRH
jgi:hypothetical protein